MAATTVIEQVPGHDKGQLTLRTFLTSYVPFLASFQLLAMLVVTHRSRLMRLVILPFTIWTAFRLIATTEVGPDSPELGSLNQTIAVFVASSVMRAIGWTFDGERYQRVISHTHAHSMRHQPGSLKRIAVESFALSFDVRGIGWNWGKGTYIARPPTSYTTYIRRQIVSIILHAIALYLANASLDYLIPPQAGGTIYDVSLPFALRHIAASIASLLLGSIIYFSLNMTHSIVALMSVLLFGQDPASWPPLFDSPWLSTSLTEFWGKRWHQLYRHAFASAGGRPLSLLFGQAGYVLGTFFMSGVAHAIEMWDREANGDFLTIVGCFLAMGGGIILEYMWRAMTGYRVGGIIGRIWMLVWLAGWSNIMFDVWGRRGMMDTTGLTSTRQHLNTPW